MMERDPNFAPAWINLGTIHFHLREFDWAEQLYRTRHRDRPQLRAGVLRPGQCAGRVAAAGRVDCRLRAGGCAGARYADAHYNLALAHERRGETRAALRHWQAYARLDKGGPWSDHARGQIRKLLDREKLTIAWRAESFLPPRKGGGAQAGQRRKLRITVLAKPAKTGWPFPKEGPSCLSCRKN
jgi:tetratricopeptide (TPR) repeat protein